MKKKHIILFIILTVILFITILISITIGVANISPLDSLKIIVNKIFQSNNELDGKKIYENIIWNIRVPRIIVASLVGIGLSVTGASYQSLFKNPMADPYILGVSSGAGLGATIGIVLGLNISFLGISSITILAFIMSILTIVAVYTISKVGRKTPITSLILSGVAISYLFSSIISILMIFNSQEADKIVFWLMGSLTTANWDHIKMLTPIVLLGSFFIWIYSRELNIMLMGEESAQMLGVDIEKIKLKLFLIVSLIVSTIVSITGIIGFVGLIIPHTVRMIVGANNRILIPISAISGGIFMIISDTIARTVVSPTELPVGAVTALFGGPYFIYLISKNKKKVF